MKTVHVLLIVAGVSLAGFVGCCGVVGIVMNSIPEPTVEQLAAREAADQEKKARYEERNKNVKDHLDSFLSFTKDAPVTHVSSYSDKIEVTVSNEFFLVPRQVRLQFAQNFLSLWQTIHCPDEPEVAGLKIVDANGNEVGGSRAGKVWVAD